MAFFAPFVKFLSGFASRMLSIHNLSLVCYSYKVYVFIMQILPMFILTGLYHRKSFGFVFEVDNEVNESHLKDNIHVLDASLSEKNP